MGSLDGKVAIVTGAAGGIGKGIAAAFAREGATVILADLDFAAARCAATEIATTGAKVVAWGMDVTEEYSVGSSVSDIVETFGRIDILVSNADIQIVSPIDELAFADWKRMLAIHLDGAFLTTKACLPQMYGQGSGSIIYIGSIHSKVAAKLKAPYVTAKHGLIGLAKVVAKEGAPHGVRANVVCPGFMLTSLVEERISPQAGELGISNERVVMDAMLNDAVDGELTTIEDVTDAALFFACSRTKALTGQSLVVRHGWFME